MFQSLDPFQQVILGISFVAIIMISLVIFLTNNPNFENTDRMKKLLDLIQKNSSKE